MGRISINSEYSAQRSDARPNPMLGRAMAFAAEELKRPPRALRVADQGCGKLRHLQILSDAYREVFLVDRAAQLGRMQKLFGAEITVRDYVGKSKRGRGKIATMTDAVFGTSELQLDIVFNLCVFDVVPPKERAQMAGAAHRNLAQGGLFILVIPRNDQSILRRCTDVNRHRDGHVFRRGRVTTFYSNFRDLRPLKKRLERSGFTVRADLSVYRQACLILER